MHALATTVAFGQFVRNIHRWAAHLMVLAVFAHLLRVFYSGAYKPPRQFNWVIGVFLLLGTLFLSFTGYLLPWDQLSYWAITVGTNIASYVPVMGDGVRKMLLGGGDVGSATLLRFYVLHVYFVPALLVIGLCIHIWRVRKDGFAVADREEEEAAPEAEVAVVPEEVSADA
jgi:quinol-cytochrome oxidoreductase complex cytochrome b subunit